MRELTVVLGHHRTIARPLFNCLISSQIVYRNLNLNPQKSKRNKNGMCAQFGAPHTDGRRPE